MELSKIIECDLKAPTFQEFASYHTTPSLTLRTLSVGTEYIHQESILPLLGSFEYLLWSASDSVTHPAADEGPPFSADRGPHTCILVWD